MNNKSFLIRPKFSEILGYLNMNLLFSRHFGVKGNLIALLKDKNNEKIQKLNEQFEETKEYIIKNKIIMPIAIYDFFKAELKKDKLLILNSNQNELTEFKFHPELSPPLPKGERGLGGEGFLSSGARGARLGAEIALFIVSTGHGILEKVEGLNQKGEFVKSHILYALALESAEAMAEYTHAQIRQTWKIAKEQGFRVSFGYACCPDLSDQKKLFELLKAEEKINVKLTESFMMTPEASVSAVVFKKKVYS